MKQRKLQTVLIAMAGVAVVACAVTYLQGGSEETATPESRVNLPEVTAVGKAIFPHDMHIMDLELECTVCHHETNAAVLNLPHEDYFDDFWIDCQSCHAETATAEPQSCDNCHSPHLADIADETLISKVVIHQNCWSCHDIGSGVEASNSCGMCHEEP